MLFFFQFAYVLKTTAIYAGYKQFAKHLVLLSIYHFNNYSIFSCFV